jgi:hypothetical protein
VGQGRIFGAPAGPEEAPGESTASRRVSTSFAARHDGTDPPDTFSRAAGRHAPAAQDVLVAHSPEARELQMDEEWSFVARKEKNCDEDDPEDR